MADMALFDGDDLLEIVHFQRMSSQGFRNRLEQAVREQDEAEIERLARIAVRQVVGVYVDIPFTVVDAIVEGRWPESDEPAAGEPR